MGLMSKTPFPVSRVPRRGLVAVQPEDPDYVRICTEQGLEHLLHETPSPGLPNGVNGSACLGNEMGPPGTNGALHSPKSHPLPLVNGNGTSSAPPVNGINGTSEATVVAK